MSALEFERVPAAGDYADKYVATLPDGATVHVERSGTRHWAAWQRPPGQTFRTAITRYLLSPEEAISAAREHYAKEATINMKTRETIPLDLIDDNPWQPRVTIEPEALEELADSIANLGLLQAPLGRRVEDGRVQLAFGHRRIGGCKLLHQRGAWGDHIDMDIAELTDEQMVVLGLDENVRRRDLNQLEVLRAYKRAIDETELTVQGLADQLGMNRPTLANNLRVLSLPDFVLQYVESGDLGITVAREFLALQNGDHAHVEDMGSVIGRITDNYRIKYEGASPNWSRRNVRSEICEQVANNEQDFRPLGKREAGMHGMGGAVREATFDVEAFAADRPDTLHTMPAGDKSRLWTCDVKEWRRRQTQATREANKKAEAKGVSRETQGNKSVSRDQQFEQALAQDPVWKKIVAAREKKGPNRPVTDDEKTALGTRAELRVVDVYGEKAFWKTLRNDPPERVHEWEDGIGSQVPPFFNLSGCMGCVAGAAYATSSPSYYWNGIRLICTNKACFEKKLAGDEAAHREKVEAELLTRNRQDGEMIKVTMGRLAVLTRKDLRTLASSLIAAQPELELHHAMGVPHKKWSYKSVAVKYVTGLLEHQPAHFDRWGGNNGGKAVVKLESLDQVPDDDLLELTVPYEIG